MTNVYTLGARDSRPDRASANSAKQAAVEVPDGLEPMLDLLVTEYALKHKEEPSACRRAVEIAVLQRGIAAVREGLKK